MTHPRARKPAPRKALGQHFLLDPEILARIAAEVRVPPGGVVVEVGAGTGQLTEALLARHFTVVALELEARLVEHLRRRFAGHPRLTVLEADARVVEPGSVVPQGARYSVAGNLPYFAANPIVRHFLEAQPQPVEMVAMVQREVGAEMAAGPGEQSLLSLSVQVYAEAEVLFEVAPEAFHPPPKVRSSVVRLVLRAQPLIPSERLAAFFSLARNTFRNPRKQLHNALARGAWLPTAGAQGALAGAGIDPTRRPETLSIQEWLRLLDAVEEARTDA